VSRHFTERVTSTIYSQKEETVKAKTLLLLSLLGMDGYEVVQTSNVPADEPHSTRQLPFPEGNFI